MRPQGLFGPHDKVMLPRLLQMIKRYGNLLLPRGGAAMVDMTYLENAVHAMWLATLKKIRRPAAPTTSPTSSRVRFAPWCSS